VRVRVLSARGDDTGTVEPLVQQAAMKALAAAVEQAGIVELVPWVRLEVWCPEESSAGVLADLAARGAIVQGIASGRLGARISGRSKLEAMLGYVTRLRSMTKGRGLVTLQPLGLLPAV
jgi:elongation factor G